MAEQAQEPFAVIDEHRFAAEIVVADIKHHAVARGEQWGAGAYLHFDTRKLSNRFLQRLHFQHFEQCFARGGARGCCHYINVGGHPLQRDCIGVECRRD